MVLLGFAAETCNHVSGYAAVRNHAANLLDTLKIPFAVIFSSHLLKHDAASRLHGQVDMLADVFIFRHGVDHLVADVLRMRCRESYPEFRTDLSYHLEKLGEIHLFSFLPDV